MPFRLPLRPFNSTRTLWTSTCLHRPLPASQFTTKFSTTSRTEILNTLLERTHPTEILEEDDFHRISSRHVLRGILRECTYFPDQFAASWIRQHALMRFRTYEAKNKKHVSDEEYTKRLETIRRKSRQGLYQMRRANEGDRKMLLKALSMAYGRVGKRRRELLSPLLPVGSSSEGSSAVSDDAEYDSSQASPTATKSATPSTSSTSTRDKQSSKGREDGPVKTQVKEFVSGLPLELRTLVQSQITASPPAIARRNPRRLGVEIPELNTWFKPMPAVRVKNQISKWYANLLDTVQPPLPDQEWFRLRDLAMGTTRAEPPIPRRAQITTPPSVLEMTVMRGKLPADMFRKDRAHKITPRFMRRLWADVFSQCPLMKYDSPTKSWKVTWGHHALQNHDDRKGVDSAATPPNETTG
ncbi:hypothetical protein Q7P36_007607 [Cladosporium allicinum]